jgi:DNA-binding NarL/FixJ family response regulator
MPAPRGVPSRWNRRRRYTVPARSAPRSEPVASSGPQPTGVRVLLVDDQDAFRRAARAVIERTPEFVLVAEAVHAEGALAAVRTVPTDLVLMDIGLDGSIDGIGATRLLLLRHPGLVVVLMSTYEPVDLPTEAHTCGATAYLTKHELSPTILRATWDHQRG